MTSEAAILPGLGGTFGPICAFRDVGWQPITAEAADHPGGQQQLAGHRPPSAAARARTVSGDSGGVALAREFV